jgi:hypothetical protein
MYLKELLREYMDVFAFRPEDMTGTPRDVVEHRLNTYRSVEPIVQKRRSMAPKQREAIVRK